MTDRSFAELAVGAGYESSHDFSSAMQPVAYEPNWVTTPHCDSDHDGRKDYFVHRDGVSFAGTHLLIDLIGASNLDDLESVEAALRQSAIVAGATILNVDLHHFEPNGGISGVVVLAESHISIHTWPERNFAALDIFMCGDCNPYKALPVLQAAFQPGAVQLNEQKRGLTL